MLFYPFIYLAFILLLHYQCMAQDASQGTKKLTIDATEEILNKITKISIQSLSSATKEGKLEILKEVEKKLLKAAKSLGKKGEIYVELIMKGIKQKALEENNNNSTMDVRMDKTANNKASNSPHKNKLKLINKDEFEIDGNASKNKIEVKIPLISGNDTEYTLENKHRVDNIEENKTSNQGDTGMIKNNLKQVNSTYHENNEMYNRANDLPLQTSTKRLIQSFTPRYECESVLDRTCKNIQQMRLLKCHFGDTDVPIEKLCNGFVDCPGRTDEKFCTSQVTERVRNANTVISDAEESYALGCFPNNTKKSIITTEIITFRSILQSQQEFVEKYKYLNWSLIRNSDSSKRDGTVKQTVNEVSLIINSLAWALDAVLCSRRSETVIRRNFNDLLDKDLNKTLREVETPPKLCVCKKGHCTNGTCTDICKRVCLQKYNLARWPCESIDETGSVPMSVICDGKFDCYDQTDEKDCVTGISFAKFEAHEIFNKILHSLSVKITSQEYSSVRNMLLALHHSIANLQKVCMDPQPNLKTIRILRTEFFSLLGSIYSKLASKSTFLYKLEEVYLFLLSLNELIVIALKRSNTGNTRMIENDGCYCRNKRCSMPVCTRKCIRICIAEPKLTRYYCNGSFNKSVSIDEICDGKPQCLREDDETHCKKDVCRRHHLSLLRYNLQRLGKNKEGTSMGELLGNWKLKVSSTLRVAENNGRPTPKIIKDIVKNILNDLVNTYGAVEDYRRDNEYALEEFIDIANYVMKSIKSCGY